MFFPSFYQASAERSEPAHNPVSAHKIHCFIYTQPCRESQSPALPICEHPSENQNAKGAFKSPQAKLCRSVTILYSRAACVTLC
jgi:hypothetical protein